MPQPPDCAAAHHVVMVGHPAPNILCEMKRAAVRLQQTAQHRLLHPPFAVIEQSALELVVRRHVRERSTALGRGVVPLGNPSVVQWDATRVVLCARRVRHAGVLLARERACRQGSIAVSHRAPSHAHMLRVRNQRLPSSVLIPCAGAKGLSGTLCRSEEPNAKVVVPPYPEESPDFAMSSCNFGSAGSAMAIACVAAATVKIAPGVSVSFDSFSLSTLWTGGQSK